MFLVLRSKPCRENGKLVQIVKLNTVLVQCSIFSVKSKDTVSKCLRPGIVQAKDLWFCFRPLRFCCPLIRLICEKSEILQPHNVPVRSVYTTPLILQEDCMPRYLTVSQKIYDKAVYFNYLHSDLNIYPSSLSRYGIISF